MTKANDLTKKVREIGNHAREAFSGVDNFIDVMELATVSGSPMCALGPPGSGKSALLRYFGDALDVEVFYHLASPDTKKDALFGPIDPAQLQKGIWDRKWEHGPLTTADFVIFDEIGKAPGSVKNMLLNAMQEKKVSESGREVDIPMHLLTAATNETFADDDPAVWNRCLLRIMVWNVDTKKNLEKLLLNQHLVEKPPTLTMTRDELALMKTEVRTLAEKAIQDKDFMDVILEIFDAQKEMYGGQKVTKITNRQWLALPRIAAACALLRESKTVEPQDLMVAQHMFWDDPLKTVTISINNTEKQLLEPEAIFQMLKRVIPVDDKNKKLEIATLLIEALEVRAVDSGTLQSNAEIMANALQWQGSALPNGTNGTSGPEWLALKNRCKNVIDVLATKNGELF